MMVDLIKGGLLKAAPLLVLFCLASDLSLAATNDVESATSLVKQDEAMEQAKLALTQGNYNLAISLMTNLRQKGTAAQKKFAQEYIGVARERKGQRAFARDEYRRFIKEYPDSVEAERVKQRLAALIGLENLTQIKTLKQGRSRRSRKTDGWSNFGSLSNNYRYSATVDDNGDSRDTLSLASLDADVSTRLRTEEYELQVRFSGGHTEDFLNDGSATTQRLRYLYFYASTTDNEYKLRLGRQRSRSGGVIGRFDGGRGSFQFNQDFSVNLVAGFPVDSSRNTSIDTERDFYGISVDIEDVWEDFDFNVFAIQQNIGSLIDRQAVGGEVRYITDSGSLFSLVDYDTKFQTLNAFVVNGNHRLENKARINWSFNQRKSPYISTRNALIGQPADSIQELQLLFLTDSEIFDLAQDRTLESTSASIAISYPYTSDLDLSGSLTWLNLSDSPASGGVPGFASSGSQFYFNFQGTKKSFLFENDTSYAGIRLSKLSTSNIYSVYGNSRIPFKKNFTLQPKIRLDFRDNSNGSSQWSVAPSLRVQYQEKKHILFAETGMIYFQTSFPGVSSQTTSIYFAYLSYRYAW